jgi:hypothetical protein
MKFMLAVMMTAAGASVFNVRAELDIVKSVGGYASMEEGQIVKGTYPDQQNGQPKADHVWVQRIYTGLNASLQFNPLPITGNIGFEMRMSNEYPRKPTGDFGRTRRLYFYPYLTEADLTYYFGDSSKPLLSVTAGYFPIKYNKNSRDLGEYLFRSGTYPQTLVTDFDFSATRLAGCTISSLPIEGLSLSIMFNSNLEWTAVGDLNLSGLAVYDVLGMNIVEIGAGVSQSSILSVDTKATDGDSLLADNNNSYLKPDSTIGMYTFRGTKLMGLVSFNPQKVLPMDFFGKEDLKMYAEAAVLGIKDYPSSRKGIDYYGDITKRIPVMAGFNYPNHPLCYSVLPAVGSYLYSNKLDVPTIITGATGLVAGTGLWVLERIFNTKFRLDLLSLEGEWFGSLMPNDMYNGVFYNQPTPINVEKIGKYQLDSAHQQYKDDNIKWSVYAKRTFAEHFQIVGQVASDHLRWYAQDWTVAQWEEAFRKPSQFYYRIRLAYLF